MQFITIRDNRGNRLLVDTGAQVSVLVVRQISDAVRKRMRKSTVKLRGISQVPLTCIGEVDFVVEYGKHRFTNPFLVVDIGSHILGVDFLKRHDWVIHPGARTVEVAGSGKRIEAMTIPEEKLGNQVREFFNLQVVKPDESGEFARLKKKHAAIFRGISCDRKIFQGVEHHIIVKGRPVKAFARKLRQEQLEKVREHFGDLQKQGIVRRAQSAWSSPLCIVVKKDGGLRICGDYLALNAITEPDNYPVPNVQEVFESVAGSQYFSSIDAIQAYYLIPMHQNDIGKTAVVTCLIGSTSW